MTSLIFFVVLAASGLFALWRGHILPGIALVVGGGLGVSRAVSVIFGGAL